MSRWYEIALGPPCELRKQCDANGKQKGLVEIWRVIMKLPPKLEWVIVI